eukprot:COSAG01_NODE_2162_length_8259_cov_2.289371_9_plen_183_part_00
MPCSVPLIASHRSHRQVAQARRRRAGESAQSFGKLYLHHPAGRLARLTITASLPFRQVGVDTSWESLSVSLSLSRSLALSLPPSLPLCLWLSVYVCACAEGQGGWGGCYRNSDRRGAASFARACVACAAPWRQLPHRCIPPWALRVCVCVRAGPGSADAARQPAARRSPGCPKSRAGAHAQQ